MGARMFVWPRYVLEVDGKRATLPRTAGAAVARMFRSPGHFIPPDELVDAVYFDDPDGGPLTARRVITVCLFHARSKLADVGAEVQGWSRTGGYRLLFRWHSPDRLFHELDLEPAGYCGPHRYVAPEIHVHQPP